MPGTLKSGGSRVYLTRYGSGPSRAPVYYPNAKAGTPSVNPGGITTIWGPDPHRYNNFVPVDEVQAGQERTTMDIMGRYPVDRLSDLLAIAQSKCSVDALIPIGECRDPSRINSGWDKMLVLLDAKLTTWTLDRDLGALEPGDNAAVNEQSTLSAAIVGEVDRMRLLESAAADVAGEVTGVVVCDSPSCGDCGGSPGDGCQRVFAITASSVASPSSANDLVFSTNGGSSWSRRVITVSGSQAEPNGIACVGDYIVILVAGASLLAYISVADLLAGTGEWVPQTVISHNLNAIYSAAPDMTWIAGDDGYVWLLQDATATVQVKQSGGTTTNSLRAIHAFDTWNVVAVGVSNTVIASNDAGETWRAITGPAVGVTLSKVWMRSATEWLVGTQTGNLYYTIDAGASWTALSFPGSGSGVVRDIQFAKDLPNVGFMSHSTSAPSGRILRTIDGGHSWYVMPEPGVAGAIPANNYITSIAVCHANRIYAGGLAAASDGIMLIGSAA